MRIRSIKYKSGNNSNSHSELPERGLVSTKIQAISTQNLHVYSYLHKKSTKGVQNNEISRTLLTTFQCTNFEENNNFQLKRNNFFTSKSVDKNIKKTSIHNRQRNHIFDKQNRSAYLRFAKNIDGKGSQTQLLKNKIQMKEDKITPKMYNNFCFNKQQNIETNKKINLSQQKVKSKQQKIDEIILGQNLTHGIDTLQKQILQIQEQTMQEKQNIDKIRQQIHNFGPKIQAQLQGIVKNFKKGLQNLQSYLRKQKSSKCTQLVNWKGVISTKREQYQEQFEMIDTLNEKIQKIQVEVGQRTPQNLQLEKIQE